MPESAALFQGTENFNYFASAFGLVFSCFKIVALLDIISMAAHSIIEQTENLLHKVRQWIRLNDTYVSDSYNRF